MPMRFLDKYAPLLQSVLRIMTGLLFLEHGTSKLLHFPPNPQFDNISLTSLIGVSGCIELIAGALVALGLFSRCAAFVASGMMAVAYFMVLFPQGFFPMLNGGDAAILYSFLIACLTAAGPGPNAISQK